MRTTIDPSTAWQLDGDSAAAYERYLVPAIFDSRARPRGVRRPSQGERVLDVACGTGVVARHAAPLVAPSGHDVGVDVDAGMLAVAAATVSGGVGEATPRVPSPTAPSTSRLRAGAHVLPRPRRGAARAATGARARRPRRAERLARSEHNWVDEAVAARSSATLARRRAR